jgi:alkaline phosphatase D
VKRTAILLTSLASLLPGHQATGVKVGEVTTTTAIVWMRNTLAPERVEPGKTIPFKRGLAPLLPRDMKVEELQGAVPGAPGEVRVRYSTNQDLNGAVTTRWTPVNPTRDFTHQFRLTGLQPDTIYYYSAETRTGKPLRGQFRTAPERDAEKDVKFTVITGQAYGDLDDARGYHAYEAMLKAAPDFIVPTGDNVYYDNEFPRAVTPELARHHWHRMYSLPRLVAFHLRVPGFWEKDDHDTLANDCWPTMNPKQMHPLTFEIGRRIFLEQTPMGQKTWRTVRWGKWLEVWLVEGRDFRSPNRMPDGPNKTIWGAEQKRWLKESVERSDARWKVIVSPTPVVGPDRVKKGDNHANEAFAYEGKEIRQWASGRKNLFFACGDRHWQYHSVHPETKVHEFSSGPVSDEHAEGSPGENPVYHRFHREKGGYLMVAVRGGKIAFEFHGVKGSVDYRWSPE